MLRLPREKISRVYDEVEEIYSEERWRILREKRARAKKIMEALSKLGVKPIVHGSIARGDVHPGSDIDVVVLNNTPSYMIEYALYSAGYNIYLKRIIQATPNHTPKAYLILDPTEEVVVSFPLAKLLEREVEFYYFGGAVDLDGLSRNARVPGVNKKLEIIIPTERGHVKTSIIGREEWAASILGISIDTVLERVRVLSRRDEVGRTGVYLKIELEPSESIEDAISREASRNPALRRVLMRRGV